MQRYQRLFYLSALLIGMINPVWSQSEGVLRIMAAHPVLTGLAENLTAGSEITINRAVPENLPASRQLAYITGRGAEKIAEIAQQSDAVLSIRSIWPADQLYPIARRSNIRIIEIDVAQPIDGFMPGVTLIPHAPDGNIAQPWLDAKNLGRMADITANELTRMMPSQRQHLEENLSKLKRKINILNQETETKLAKIDDIAPILILSQQMISLVNAYSLEYTLWLNDNPQPRELENLNSSVQKKQIKVALSHVQPEESINKILMANNVQLLIIPTHVKGDPVNHLQNITNQLIHYLTVNNN